MRTRTLSGESAINNAGRNLLIAKYSINSTFANALYDDFYIYNRALSEDEIRYLYLDKPELMVNNYLYNGGSEYNSTAQWYETMFRGYDPVLGRMNGEDVMADTYSSLTPYNFAFNDPVSLNDPTGADPNDGWSPPGITNEGDVFTNKIWDTGYFGSSPGYQPMVIIDGRIANPRGPDGTRSWNDAMTYNMFMAAANGNGPTDGIVVGGQSLNSYDRSKDGQYGAWHTEKSWDYSTEDANVETNGGLMATLVVRSVFVTFATAFQNSKIDDPSKFAAALNFGLNIGELSRQGYGAIRYGRALQSVEGAGIGKFVVVRGLLDKNKFINSDGKVFSNLYRGGGRTRVSSAAIKASKTAFNNSAKFIKGVGTGMTYLAVATRCLSTLR